MTWGPGPHVHPPREDAYGDGWAEGYAVGWEDGFLEGRLRAEAEYEHQPPPG